MASLPRVQRLVLACTFIAPIVDYLIIYKTLSLPGHSVAGSRKGGRRASVLLRQSDLRRRPRVPFLDTAATFIAESSDQNTILKAINTCV